MYVQHGFEVDRETAIILRPRKRYRVRKDKKCSTERFHLQGNRVQRLPASFHVIEVLANGRFSSTPQRYARCEASTETVASPSTICPKMLFLAGKGAPNQARVCECAAIPYARRPLSFPRRYRVYMHQEGLCRLATEPYRNDAKSFGNRFIHLTNYSINRKSSRYEPGTMGYAASPSARARYRTPNAVFYTCLLEMHAVWRLYSMPVTCRRE